MTYVTPTETPIYDRLRLITGGNTLATYHGQKGGEWDTLAATPLKLRRRLTGAGWLTLDGEKPDVFADLLCMYAGSEAENFDQGNPIAWFIREADRATTERSAAAQRDRLRRLAKASGDATYYDYRSEWCLERGYLSLWEYRKAKGWR